MRIRIKRKEAFYISCSRCGVKIRKDDNADSFGVCLRCFYELLKDRLLAQNRTSKNEFASDR